jgi:para-nitrobenzyl esterase
MKRPLDNMMMITVVCLLAVAAVGAVGQAVGIVVNTGQGQIKGLEMTARDGDKYTGFLGVPFAQPPVGEYRWKRPLEAQPWQGMLAPMRG